MKLRRVQPSVVRAPNIEPTVFEARTYELAQERRALVERIASAHKLVEVLRDAPAESDGAVFREQPELATRAKLAFGDDAKLRAALDAVEERATESDRERARAVRRSLEST